MQSTMNFTGIKLIPLPVPARPAAEVRQQQIAIQAVSWQQAQSRLKHKPFNGIHLSQALQVQAMDACSVRHAQRIAYKPDTIAKLQSPCITQPSTVPPELPGVAIAVAALPPQSNAPVRCGSVALRQALAQLGVTVTRIAELTHTDRRSAHKHVHATPSSKVKPWADRSQAEQTQALEMARKLLT